MNPRAKGAPGFIVEFGRGLRADHLHPLDDTGSGKYIPGAQCLLRVCGTRSAIKDARKK
jgi:hypothetical protein